VTATDFTRKFTFERTPVRGRIIRLEETWAQLRRRCDLDCEATELLAHLAAAAGLMAQDLKIDASLTIQLRNRDRGQRGTLTTAMAECRDRSRLRGIVRAAGEASTPTSMPRKAPGDLSSLFGTGDLAITLRGRTGETYQGVVEIGTGGVAAHVERYFAASEQLPTRIWIAQSGATVGGLLLQRLPHAVTSEADEDDWRRLTLLAQTVSAAELGGADVETLLRRLYPGDRVRLHAAEPIEFGCSCTRERSTNALRLMDRSEIADMLATDGRIDVTCEFCGARYAYDAVDAEALMHDGTLAPSSTIH
jgi:molecular chaperone Hsp33